jgi:hypothetical protein
MLNLVKVEDIYKDVGSSLHKTLKKGVGTASPYSDFQILIKVRIEVDGQKVFEHPRFDDLSEIEVGVDSAKYDMEEYQLPPVLRKVLKYSKLNEVFEIKTRRADKLIPLFPDSNGIFKPEFLSNFS